MNVILVRLFKVKIYFRISIATIDTIFFNALAEKIDKIAQGSLANENN